MPTSPSSNPATEPAMSSTTPGGQSSTQPTRLRRAWRLARSFLVLACELAGYAALLYLAGVLMIYFVYLRAGGVFRRSEGEIILSGLGGLVVRLAILLVVVEYLAVISHEVGHALAAWLMGYRFGWLRVEGFVVRRTPRGPRLGVSAGALLGGTTHCLPYHGTAMRLRHIVYVLGGAVMSLAAGVVAWLALARGFGRVPDPLSQPLSTGLILFAALSGIGGTLNLVPIPGRKMYSDGMLIVRTIRGGPSVSRALALSGLRGCVERRERPRAWPGSLVEHALALADLVPNDPQPYLFAYSWTLDRGEIARAGTYLDALLARPAASARQNATIALEAAYYLARYRGDAIGARDHLARGEGAVYSALLRPRAEAALALLEERPVEALVLAEAGLAASARLARDPKRFNVEEEAESLRELVALAQVALASSSPAPPSM